MKLPNKESTFSEVDLFEDGDMSDLNEEVSECESDPEEEEDMKLATLRNRTYTAVRELCFNHISDSYNVQLAVN